MKTNILCFIISLISSTFAHCASYIMLNDTIDYERTRMYLEVPELSVCMSSHIMDCEGSWICYPIPQEGEKTGILVVDYSVMNKNYLFETDDYDIELWNTINKNKVGSRCFKKDGLNYRIDRFADGLEIFYIDIADNYFDLINKVMKSVYKTQLKESDPPLNKHKRKIIEYQ